MLIRAKINRHKRATQCSFNIVKRILEIKNSKSGRVMIKAEAWVVDRHSKKKTDRKTCSLIGRTGFAKFTFQKVEITVGGE